MSVDSSHQQWISGADAARLLGCAPRQVPKLASKGFLTVRRLPGCDPRYLRSDVDRLACQATQPASVEPPGAEGTADPMATACERVSGDSQPSHEGGVR